MSYRRWAPAVLAIPALLLAACGSSTSPGTASLEKIKTSIGPVLADAKGFTLYWYAKDTHMSSACTGSCATAWPPVTGKPAAAMGVRLVGKFGTITRGSGMLQATYKGHPLYTYAGDSAPGQVKGNGLGGIWHALRVNSIGAVSPGMVMSSSSPTPSASMSSGGGGY
jgi:predicted lipoprotein with Yx(FWY)xxD motif